MKNYKKYNITITYLSSEYPYPSIQQKEIKHYLVIDYEDFGAQVIANEIVRMRW